MKRELIEKEILGALCINQQKIPLVLRTLTANDFKVHNKHAQVIFKAWQEDKNVTTELKHNNLLLADVIGEFTPRALDKACKELKELTISENVSTILKNAQVPESDIHDFVASLQENLTKAIDTGTHEESSIESILEEFENYQALFEEKKKNGGSLLGISTGYPKLDSVIDGLRKGHLWVIGGYTNLGKTYASLNILTHLLKQKKRCVFYSLEMSRVDILGRILGIVVGENGSSIAKGYVDASKVTPAKELVQESALSIHSTKTELSHITLSMYEEVLKNKPELFVIDFLQLITVDGARSEYETTTQAILKLQEVARKYDVPIIVLSQVSNEGAKAGDQQVMGFKGSGHIASAADLALELVSGEENVKELREKMKKGEPVLIKWHIKKNRHGPVGTMLMDFNGRTGTFTEINEPEL